ncbi:MAG: beta-propeller domain-containing protein [Rubrivivax sp.]|nr:beta-propeller domain-containing protein [Rubrivivax sp.]
MSASRFARCPGALPASPRPALAALLALLLAACGGGGGEPTPPASEGRAGALAAARPGELASWAQGRLRALDAQGRLAGGGSFGAGIGAAAPISGALAAAPPSSRTLVQEDGVDEADLLRSTGSTLHALSRDDAGGLVLIAQPMGAAGRLGEALRVPLARDDAWQQPEGLMARSDGQALVAVSRRQEALAGSALCPDCVSIPPMWLKQGVQLQHIDTRDAARPVAGARLSFEGSLVDARRVGDTLVVVAVHRPMLQAQALPATATPGERTAAIARLSADELLPRLRRNGGAAQPLLRDTDCWLQPDNGSLAVQLTTVTLVDLRSPDLPQSTRCFAGGTEAVYLTPRNLWLATTRSTPLMESLSLVAAAPPRTDVHQFALDPTGTGGLAWRGSADVEGHLGWDSTRMSYRLSEHEGHLRVLTYTGGEGWASPADAGARRPSPARLTVLRADSAAASADGRTLATVSVLPNARRPAAIGKPGEQVYAVRFAGARGYVVTFRRIDPLYVLDLADATDPRVAGEVELPGYAETLLPLPEGLLLGLGRAADTEGRVQGLQLTLFDVADATAPRVLRSLTLGDAGSASALEQSRHGLAMRLDAAPGGAVARLALPVVLSQGPFSGFQRGLQTFEVDTAARSLVLRDLKGANDGTGAGWLGEERALLMGAQVVHLRESALAAYDW